MPTFSIPLSGLLANEEALTVIGNNLANLNTTAYKSEKPQFSDLFFQQLGTNGAGDPVQVGLGTEIASTTTQFTQGSIQNTGVPTDLAIQGDGFLQIQKGAVILYTRDGNLSVNSQGYLVTPDGSNVLGHSAANGTIDSNGALVPLTINQAQSVPPQATSDVQLTMNLDASGSPASPTSTVNLGLNLLASDTTYSTTVQVFDSLGTAHTLTYTFTNLGSDKWDFAITIPAADVGKTGGPVTIYDKSTAGYAGPLTFPTGGGTLTSPSSPVAVALPSGVSLTDGAALNFNWDPSGTAESTSSASSATPSQTGGSAAATFSTVVGVYDSLGASHTLTYTFTKTAANTWAYQITIPAADLGKTGEPVVLSKGDLQFDSNGNLTSPPSNVTGVTTNATGGLADGATNLNFTWQVFGANGTSAITQVAGASTASSSQQDGFPSGILSSFNIAADGTIEGAFTNGRTTPIGQIALATFPNSQGLLRVGTNNFMTTLASGLPTIGTPGNGGRGTIVGGGLESSNVDIATEFAQLILAQRGYEANARAFTASDQVTQDTINLGR